VTKLIEVALPIEAISAASRRENNKKTGTIRNVHKWFAPMPGPAWRALLFAALVDDPGDDERRQELLDLIVRLVPPDGGPPPKDALATARALIAEAMGADLPTVLDPFCGGGSTLVEAQRLGLPTVGSDLNPVPALITRVLTELVPKVAGRVPLVGDPAQLGRIAGGPLDGFLADVRHYGKHVRERVWGEIGDMYPTPPGGGTVIAWLWARTVRCPNPACRATAPLVSSFWLSKRRNAATWIEPVIREDRMGVRFEITTDQGGPSPGTVKRTGARCAVCHGVISLGHMREEGRAGRMGVQLMTVVVDMPSERSYKAPTSSDVSHADVDRPEDAPDLSLPKKAPGFRIQNYGMEGYADLFTNRQLATLAAFSRGIADITKQVTKDGGDTEYATAVASVLGLCVGKLARANSTQATWNVRRTGSSRAEPAFSRQALPMVWDFTEVNPFADSVGSWMSEIDATSRGLQALPLPAPEGHVHACDARKADTLLPRAGLVATDPPYFAQIGYADLSDFFYIWLRRALREVHPDLFATVATPKVAELIVDPDRHGGDTDKATRFFVEGFVEAFSSLRKASRADLPMLVVYAHGQEEREDGGLTATAWDTMLSAILEAGFSIVGTWPVHATREARQRSQASNALASYLVLICRPRPTEAKVGDLQTFLSALRAELPRAIRNVQQASISAIDLGQAAIGPGMAIFSRFTYVVDPSTGKRMTVHRALELISQVRAEVLDDFAGALSPENPVGYDVV
jgi:putative DNA methylase